MIDHISAALKVPIKNATAKLILICLCDFANQDGIAFPSRATLADRAMISDRQVSRITGELEAAGYIKVWCDPNGIQTNRYWINLPNLRAAIPKSKVAPAAESNKSFAVFMEEVRKASTVDTALFSEARGVTDPVTPMSPRSTIEAPEDPKTVARSSIAAPGDKPKQGSAPGSGWVRTIWEARYTKRYPGVSPPWTGREGASAKAIAGSLRDACRKTMGPDASEDAVQSRAAERLGAAVDAYLAITEVQDKYIASRCHPFTGLADRLPRLLATPARGKVQLGAWQ